MWIVLVSRLCYQSGLLKVIGQFSLNGIGYKTSRKFFIDHWLSLDPPNVSQIGLLEVCFFGFILVMDKSFVRH